jgi:phosphopantothenoylcysteine decarboxylase/phosphopantothenate--cysteine ligase
MNHHMWEHPATQANVATLRARGTTIVDPDVGALGSRHEWGAGRLAEPDVLLAAAEALVPAGTRPWDGLRVLVTAGGTREPIDAVRYVGNRSSGRMGFALAEEAAGLGADVTVIAANVRLARHPRISYVDVETAAELEDAARDAFAGCDLLLMAAAVADFRPLDPAAGKLKKTGRDGLSIQLEPTTDVLGALAPLRRPGQVVIGFAAEHGEGALAYGREKLARKRLDAIVVNDVGGEGIGFDAVDNEVTIVTADGERHVPRATKAQVARAVLEAADELRAAAGASGGP